MVEAAHHRQFLLMARLTVRSTLLVVLVCLAACSNTLAALPTSATHRAVIEVIPISPTAISSNGEFVAGGKSGLAYRWDPVRGETLVGHLEGGRPESLATGISDDGDVVVGKANFDPSLTASRGERAFRWTAEGGMQDIGFVSENVFGRTYSRASAVSPNGQMVVGASASADYASEAFLWTAEGGMEGLGSDLQLSHGSHSSEAFAISADGATVVGTRRTTAFGAFRWTAASGYESLPGGALAHLYLQRATAVSHDGSAIVGQGGVRDGTGLHAFYWTEAIGAIDIGTLPGSLDRSFPNGISGDGSVVIGEAYTSNFGAGLEAFIWDQAGGIRNLRSWLQDDFQVDMSDWILATAEAISADGLTIVGGGSIRPIAAPTRGGNWRLRFVAIPEPGAASLAGIAILAAWPLFGRGWRGMPTR